MITRYTTILALGALIQRTEFISVTSAAALQLYEKQKSIIPIQTDATTALTLATQPNYGEVEEMLTY